MSVMWIIWHSRNKQTHDEEGPNPANALKVIRENLALLELPKEKALALPGYGWRPPDGACVKINTDVGIDNGLERGEAGEWERRPAAARLAVARSARIHRISPDPVGNGAQAVDLEGRPPELGARRLVGAAWLRVPVREERDERERKGRRDQRQPGACGGAVGEKKN